LVRSPAIPSLEGLETLSRRKGVDIRPTLVRVLTDLYVQKPLHSLQEEQHYTELVLRLIEAVDIPTRAIVARKLAQYPTAPIKVVHRLARDVPEVAEPLLRHSPRLTGKELLAIIAECGPRYAKIIAGRGTLDGREAGSRGSRRQPDATLEVGFVGRERSAGLAPTSGGSGEDAAAGRQSEVGLGETFLAANRAERRRMLTDVEVGGQYGANRSWPPSDTTIRRLEAAALARNADLFVRELERGLGIAKELARRLVMDRSGEPLLAALKALGMPSDVLVRVLLFLDPAIGQSVDLVFDFSRLYDRIDPAAAVRLLASLGAVGPRRRRGPMYQPVNWAEETDRVRRASTDAARRQVGGTSPPASHDSPRGAASVKGRRQGTT
jgi:uncharacterized protein (DUF2336 family)